MAEPSISKTQRLLDLVAFLVGRRAPVPAREILRGLPAYSERWREGDETERDSVRRAFERDKRTLRQRGIPFETVSHSVEHGTRREDGYRIPRRDFYLPYIGLLSTLGGAEAAASGSRSGDPRAPEADSRSRDAHSIGRIALPEEDAALALEALRRLLRVPGCPLEPEARSALRKLTFDLDPAGFPETPIRFPDGDDTERLRGDLRALLRTLRARRRVRFRYRSMRPDRVTDREVEPYGIFFQRGRWYLVGNDLDRKELRTFRVDRMSELEVDGGRSGKPDYEVPEDFRLEDHLGREAWELGEDDEPRRVEVHLRRGAALRAAHGGLGEPVERREDGSAIRVFRVRRKSPFLRWLLALAGDAEVLRPAEWREELRALARRVAATYEAPEPLSSEARTRPPEPRPPAMPRRRPSRPARAKRSGSGARRRDERNASGEEGP